MKNTIGFAVAAAVIASSLVCQNAGAAERIKACAGLFKQSSKEMKVIGWRLSPNDKDLTAYRSRSVPNQSGYYSKTNAERERQLKDYALQIKQDVWVDDTEAIGMELLPEVGVKMDVLEEGGDYGSGKLPLYKISGLGPEGIFRATAGLPVSGRFGQETTRKWAETDKYDVMLRDLVKGTNRHLVRDVQSHDLVMMQDLEIPLEKDKEVRITYERHGSAGSAGFPEGRIMRFIWDGK